MKIRKTVVAGSFYPNSKKELLKTFEEFSKSLKKEKVLNKIRALIVPHAGYIYSGFTANMAYNISSQQKYKNIVVLGPSHHTYFKGASIALHEEYETPLGALVINTKKSKELLEEFPFLCFNEDAHFEHSSETQAPFIKHYFKNSSILEIVYSDIRYEDLSTLISKLLEDEENLLVISTDLSHFHNEIKAKILDEKCINAIQTQNLNSFETCEACGLTGVKALIKAIENKKFKSKFLHYCNSSKINGDKNKVVGYTSFFIGE